LLLWRPRKDSIGQELVLKGWVHHRRDHGGLIFIDLRDRTGICQIVLDPSRMQPETFAAAHSIRSEFVLAIRGKVIPRGEDRTNDKIPTGEIEVEVSEFEILNKSKAVPFKLDEYGHISEEVRLRYRFLDLRRAEMQRNIILRAKGMQAVREYFDGRGFLEIDTPLLNKSTPEGGARHAGAEPVESGYVFTPCPSPPDLQADSHGGRL
jgi:aspartyl-tRNA synthetase